jgi:KipI family sensor histidine kinase inhibitor
MQWTVERYGPRAWLVRFGEQLDQATMARALAVARDLEVRGPAGLREFTMGYASVLLEWETEAMAGAAEGGLPEWVVRWSELEWESAAGRRVEIPVVYDGEDLPEVARRTGMEVEEVVARHSGRDYCVWLLGFAPGFPYLGVLDESLHLPRRETPRPHVAAGSVAIAGEQTGIYPSASAGGWHVLGRTPSRLFVPEGPDEAFLLRPGDVVSFVPVEARDV